VHEQRGFSWQRTLSTAAAIVLVATASSTVAAARPSQQLYDPTVRETVDRIEVPGTGAKIVVSSYRPKGNGPFPWIVYNHGTAPKIEESRKIGRNRNIPLVHQWVDRGYAVLVPIRRGYGDSGGDHLGDSFGSCAKPDFVKAGEGAAQDILATIAWARTKPDLDQRHWLLVGQSSGSFASIYTASKQPDGLVAVLAFSPGRGGDPDNHPRKPCAPETLARTFAQIAPKVKVPVMWFYSRNDEYIGPEAQDLWFTTFRNAGARAELYTIPAFPDNRGHGVYPSPKGFPIWNPMVEEFFHHNGITMPF
jgi:dienelactone hydrolase